MYTPITVLYAEIQIYVKAPAYFAGARFYLLFLGMMSPTSPLSRRYTTRTSLVSIS